MLEKANEIPQKKRRETILENKKKAILSRKLVELKKDVPVKQKLENFTLRKINKEKLYEFLREMEFNRLLSQVISHYGEPIEEKIENKSNSIKFDLKKYQTILTIDELEKWIKKIEEKGIVAVDTETNSLNPHEANLVGISLCYSPGVACYIPLENATEKVLEKKLVLEKLKTILEDKSIKKIGQNIKFDYIIFLHNKIKLNPIEDTMLMSYALDAGRHRHNMDNLSEIHLNHKTISFKEVAGSGKSQISFDKVPIKQATQYAAEDADVTFRLYTLFKERLNQEKLLKIYELFEKPMVNLLAQMEIQGVKIDSNFLKELSKKFDVKIKKLEKIIFKKAKKSLILDHPSNWVKFCIMN